MHYLTPTSPFLSAYINEMTQNLRYQLRKALHSVTTACVVRDVISDLKLPDSPGPQ